MVKKEPSLLFLHPIRVNPFIPRNPCSHIRVNPFIPRNPCSKISLMKHLLTILSFFTLLSCHTAQTAQAVAPAPPPPVKPAAFVTWDKKMVDLGQVKKGEKRTTFFEFTNTSAENIQIDIVDACECTRVDFPRGVFAPGQKGRLDVVFDSKDKDESETIGITVVFKQNDEKGNPRIESVEYKFELLK